MWGGDVGIAEASEDAEMGVGRMFLKQTVVWCVKVDGCGGKNIKKVGSHMKSFYPKCGRKVRVKK